MSEEIVSFSNQIQNLLFLHVSENLSDLIFRNHRSLVRREGIRFLIIGINIIITRFLLTRSLETTLLKRSQKTDLKLMNILRNYD